MDLTVVLRVSSLVNGVAFDPLAPTMEICSFAKTISVEGLDIVRHIYYVYPDRRSHRKSNETSGG